MLNLISILTPKFPTTWVQFRCANTQFKAIHTLRIASKSHRLINYYLN